MEIFLCLNGKDKIDFHGFIYIAVHKPCKAFIR